MVRGGLRPVFCGIMGAAPTAAAQWRDFAHRKETPVRSARRGFAGLPIPGAPCGGIPGGWRRIAGAKARWKYLGLENPQARLMSSKERLVSSSSRAGLFAPQFADILLERQPELLPEKVGEVVNIDPQLPGQIPQQQFFAKPRLNPFRQIPYPFLPGALGRTVRLGYNGECR